MSKSVGYRRDIRATWFDTVAALRTETDDISEIRRRLDDLLTIEIRGAENRALTVQILTRIWAKPEPTYQTLHDEALHRFSRIEQGADRVWLHYGMCLLTYPFFRDAVGHTGTLLRQRGMVTNMMLKQRIIAEMGQLGSLANATKAVMYVLRQWCFLQPAPNRGSYEAGSTASTDDRGLALWLIRAALQAHPADMLPIGDLPRWSALFPFHLPLTSDDLRRAPGLDVQRHGGNIDIVTAATRTTQR